MKSRITGIAVVMAAVGLTVSACVGGASPSHKSVSAKPGLKPSGNLEVVSFYAEGSADYARLAQDAKEYEAKYPGTKVSLVFGGGQNTPKIQARWRAGNPPEVSYGFFDGTTQVGQKYQKAGELVPLDQWMDQPLDGYDGKTWRQSLLPSVKPFITSPTDNKIYAVPESITTIQMFYNKKIFADHGLTPPTTVSDLLSDAAKLKAAGIAPFAVTGTFEPYMQMWFDYLLTRYSGAKNVEAAINGTKNFASLPGVMQAADDLQTMVRSGYFLKGFESTDFTAAQLDFFQGKSAMILMGSWLQGEMAQSIPSGFQLGTFPFPSVPGAAGDPSAVFGGVNGMEVASQSKNPNAGVAWLQFLATKKLQQEYQTREGQISPYAGVPAPPAFEAVVKTLSQPDAFLPEYFGTTASTKLTAAYDDPIANLFFGKIDAAKLVSEIDKNLQVGGGAWN
jgi:ABC-type glycerol-3-phosphate transport system substrate-binding protein